MSARRPVLIWDGDCGFCRLWVERWKRATGERVEYLESQKLGSRFPELPRERLAESVALVEPHKVSYGAEAVFRALGWARAYESVPGLAAVSELVYAFIARRRPLFSRLTKTLWGASVEPPSFRWGASAFLAALSLSYLAGFLSLWSQVDGLYGSRGILPIEPFSAALRERFGSGAWGVAPSLFLLGADDGALRAACVAGAALAALALLGFARGPALLGCWALYLSFVNSGREFLSFQWDVLLLEAGFIGIFLSRWTLGRAKVEPPRAALFALKLLLFRLMLASGAVKLLSGDPSWKSWDALLFHYETQPLPTPLAWYAHQLPAWLQRGSVAVVLFIELVAPFGIFLARRPRLLATALLLLLQLLIAATGNYCFFNLITIGLCLSLIDDRGRRLQSDWSPPSPARRRAAALACALLAVLGVIGLGRTFGARLPNPFTALQPLHLVSNYGLFAVMTTTRPEIVLEGSPEGTVWVEYPFRFKPGPLWVAPHQPRLDWQMWFAALSDWRENQWFINLLARILEGSPPVLDLLGGDPLAGVGAKYLRATVYEYRFTRLGSKEWWTREKKGLYCPIISAAPKAESGSAPRPSPGSSRRAP